jgi:UMF1 family MFS transporter
MKENENPPPVTPVKKSEIFGWCCFDFANSAFTTVIITVVYAVYFQNVVAAGKPAAAAWWGGALAVSQLIVILFSPLIGAMADLKARKKTFLMITTIVCSVLTASLYFVGAGEVALALGLVIVANAAFSFSENLCGGFLPEISTPQTAGRISGYGWSFGYFGGLLSLVLALVILKSGDGRAPWTFVMTGGFFMLAALPTLLLLKERAVPRALPAGETLWSAGWRENFASLGNLKKDRTLSLFFVALCLFTAGLTAVVAYASIYASKVLGMEQSEIIKLFVVLQLAGVVGAYGFGFLQDRKGAKFSLVLSLLLWIGVCVWGWKCQTKTEFYGIGVLAGIAMGSLQSAGRAVISTFTPEGKSGEFFGYWGFFTKLAAVVGPPVFGVLATAFGYRIAILADALFFLAGLLVLLPLKLDRRPAI